MLVYVAVPLLNVETAGDVLPTDVTVVSDLKRRRLVVYDNIKDLEFEYQSGKIAKGDYEALRANYFGEATALMVATREAEQLKENDALIEREIAARRAQRKVQQPKPDYTCKACGYENPVPVKFCGECGAAMTTPKAKNEFKESSSRPSERRPSGKRR
jgi:DNA-directed RNA polymerase subunit M/transcription elongation factor TFIIS